MNQPCIIGIVGLQGCGKTMAMTALGYREHLNGKKIYANYSLKYPYTYIDSLEQLDSIHNGIILLDEFWLWVFNRSSMSRINQDIVKIIMLNRKRRVSILYTEQVYTQVDKLIRNVTTYWILPQIRPLFVPSKEKIKQVAYKKHPGNIEKREQYENELYEQTREKLNTPDNFSVLCDVYDANGRYRNKVRMKNLKILGKLYNTYEEVEPHILKRCIPFTVQQGIELENYFVEAIEPLTWIKKTDHLPDSGWKSGKKFDVIVETENYGTLAIDVKSTNQTRVSVHPEELPKQIENARGQGMIPFIVFPRLDRIGIKKNLKSPDSWMFHPLENSYLLNLKQPPKYGKLEKNSLEFPFMQMYLQNQIEKREEGTLFTS